MSNDAIRWRILTTIKVIIRTFVLAIAILEILMIRNLTLKIWIKVRSDVIRWQISTSLKVIIHIFALALTVFEVLTFQNFDLANFRSRSTSTAPSDGEYKLL